jgi:DNA replication and repair protein RecF
MEEMLLAAPASDVEDRYRAVLKDNRARDAAAGRTLDGPHLTDLAVTYGPKDIPAASASTGEQKALLIRLILAHAGLIAEMTGFAPVLLLDEIAAHLDPDRRAALYNSLERIGAQVWMTGADAHAFAGMAGRAEVFQVGGGEARHITTG